MKSLCFEYVFCPLYCFCRKEKQVSILEDMSTSLMVFGGIKLVVTGLRYVIQDLVKFLKPCVALDCVIVG